MDRIFSSVNYDYKDKKTNHYLHEIKNERCPHEDDLRKHQPDSTTCKRITGLMSRSYLHSQLLPATHEKLDFYFGRGNIGVFLQGTKCVTQERLVNADGQNGYVTDENIQKYMNMPLLLVHGKHNALFDIESFERSKGQFKRLLPNRQTRTVNRYLRFKNFGHVDLILGKDAPKVVIPKIVKFFDASLAAQTTAAPIKNNRCHARMARTGPIVGWVRPDKDKDGFDVTVIRVLIEIEDRYADQAIAALTVTKYANEIIAQVWPVQRQLFQALGVDSPANNANPFNLSHTIEPQVSYSVADISVPTEFIDKVSIEMVSIHTYAGPPVAGATSETLGFPPGWGVPMDRQDLDDPKSKLPFSLIKQGKALFLERSNGKPLVTLLPAVVAKLSGIPAKSAVAQSPVYDEKSLLDNRNTRLVPAYTLSSTANIASLLNPLIDDLELSNDLTFRADPKTLSRQRRTLRDYTQRVLELERKQLEDTKTGNLTFFAAGCRHPGLTGFENVRADASLRRAHDDINASQPRFMLMLGDQIYADVRGGVVDTESPIEKLLPRYRGAFGSSSSFRKIAKRLPMYMVMDDHEINDNWSQEQVLQSKLNAVLQHNALAAFTIFQFEHGPSFPDDLKNPPERVEGFNYCYEYNDIPFLVLDTRTQRTRVPDRRILHSSQWRWLEEWLRKQQQAKGACPKFIASGSVVAPGLRESTGYPSPRTADSWQMCADDRKRLLSFIATEEIENVVFLSSDYHCSAAAEITFTHSPVRAWGIVAPPLHAPMPFANVQASGVSESERIAIARGAATVKSTAWDGEGWLTCAVSRVKKNSFRLDLTFNLRKLSESDWHMDTHPVKTWRL